MRNPAVNIGIRAARAGGRVLLRLMNRIDSLDVTEKERNDFVSEADRAAEAAIIEELRRAFPQHAILAEEGGASGDNPVKWIIDPLDGTRNYLHGFPHFSISIAMQDRDHTEIGIVYDPLREELFTATRGAGALLNDRRIRVNPRRGLDRSLIATAFPFRKRHLMPQFMGMFNDIFEQAADIRRPGSAALDLAYVACGRFDGFWELDLKPWDMAAGALLIKEAGGRCTDLAGGNQYLETGNIVTGSFRVADDMLKAIQPHLSETLKA